MTLLFDLDYLNEALSNHTYENKEILDILFNENNSVVLNREMIEYLEVNLPTSSQKILKAFLYNVSDKKRVIKDNSIVLNDYENSFKKYYDNSDIPLLIPVCKELTTFFNRENYVNLFVFNSNELYDDSLKKLLSQNSIIISYQDFNNNDEIISFIDNIYKIPKKIETVYCFNRDISSRFIERFKSERIHYYTLFNRRTQFYEYKDFRNELRSATSPLLKLYTIKNTSLIHERKIFIHGLCISFDNAFENILVEEPTWDITIQSNLRKQKNWLDKINKFQTVN